MDGRQESTDIGIRRRSVADAQRGSDGLAGYIAAWPGRHGFQTMAGPTPAELYTILQHALDLHADFIELPSNSESAGFDQTRLQCFDHAIEAANWNQGC